MLFFHDLILQLCKNFAKSESPDPIRKRFSYGKVSPRLYEILTQLNGIVVEIDSDVSLHKLELVEGIKCCLNKLEIQRQIDIQRIDGEEGSKATVLERSCRLP